MTEADMESVYPSTKRSALQLLAGYLERARQFEFLAGETKDDPRFKRMLLRQVVALMKKLLTATAIVPCLITTTHSMEPGLDQDHSGFITLDVLNRKMTWTITNLSGHNLRPSFLSQDRAKTWSLEVVNNQTWKNYWLICQSGEYICVGALSASAPGTAWGVLRKDSCNNCCWRCGEAIPSYTFYP
jgi:hypothetical protein